MLSGADGLLRLIFFHYMGFGFIRLCPLQLCVLERMR